MEVGYVKFKIHKQFKIQYSNLLTFSRLRTDPVNAGVLLMPLGWDAAMGLGGLALSIFHFSWAIFSPEGEG